MVCNPVYWRIVALVMIRFESIADHVDRIRGIDIRCTISQNYEIKFVCVTWSRLPIVS